MRALRAFDQFRGGEPRAWLLAIVRNCCYTQLRGRPRVPNESLEAPGAREAPDPRPDPEARLAAEKEGDRLRRALEVLPLDFREVLLLKEFEDLSYKEIAAVVGIPIGTVMSRLSRARERLQAELVSPEGGMP